MKRKSRKGQIHRENAKRPNAENHKRSKKARVAFGEMANEANHATQEELGMPLEALYGAIVRYINNYLYQIEDLPPKDGSGLWELMAGHSEEYYQSVKIRDSANAQGKGRNRNCLTGQRERTNYAGLDYIQRVQDIQNEEGAE